MKCVVIAVFVCALCLTSQVFAVTGCTNTYLQGVYGYQISGVATGDAGSVPVLGYGRLVLDGAGTISAANMVVAVNGSSEEASGTGSYSVSTDCSVTFKLKDAETGATSNFAGVVVNAGNSALFAQTDDGAAISGTLQRTRRTCYGGEMNGTFGFRFAGSGATPFQVVGVAAPRPGGILDVTEWVFAKGKTNKFTTTGSYKVNSDCTASVKIDSAKSAKAKADGLSFKGILVNHGKSLISIQTDKALAGEFSAQ